MITQSQVIHELHAATCSCGEPKVKKTAFCGTCWRLLPPNMQRACYAKIGQGFEQAYDAAKRHIRNALARRESVKSGEEPRDPERGRFARVDYRK